MGISKHINCDGDLKVILSGVSVLSGSGRWTLCLYVGDTFCCGLPSRYVSCGFDGATYRNCRVLDGGDIECWFRRPNLGCGRLRYKLYVGVSDADFSPDLRSDVYPGDTGYDVGNFPSSDITPGIDFTVLYGLLYPGIRYDTAQTLPIEDQNQALENIGADLVRLPYSLLNTTLSDEMMKVVDNARGIILVDTPSDYRNPTVFIKGNNVSGSCIFVAFVTGDTYSQFTLDKSTKLLSGISSGTTYGGSVRYAEEQSLTDTQKQQARTNIKAARGQDIQNITGSAPTLSIVGGVTYVCGELTTLTVNSIEDSTDESWVYFTSGSTPTVVTWPTGANIAGDTTIIPNVSYEVCIRKSRIIIVHYEQS